MSNDMSERAHNWIEIEKWDDHAPMFGGKSPSKPKVDRYNWCPITDPGEFRWIDKQELKVDIRYQRGGKEVSRERVLKYARNWSWALCGVLLGAFRFGSEIWIFEGGTRLRAALLRSDIDKLPVFIFRFQSVEDEAIAFREGAKTRATINAFQCHRADLFSGEPLALAIQKAIDERGLKLVSTASTPIDVACVAALKSAWSKDPAVAEKTLDIFWNMPGDMPIQHDVFKGMFALLTAVNDKQHDRIIERAGKYTREMFSSAVRNHVSVVNRGGEIVFRTAILMLLNKGCRNKIKLDD